MTDQPTPFTSLLPPHQAAVVARLGEVFHQAGEDLAVVGGVVRDLLIGDRAVPELDFTTSALPEVTARLGLEAGATSSYDIGARFGTIGFIFEDPDGGDPLTVEITTWRAEHYPDETRHPAVAFGESTLHEDLSRRDFTMNAIAADAVTGDLTDPFDGQADVALGVIRAVGDPDLRFAEDPLRLLRAARFVAQLGFRIDPETEAAMARQASTLSRISRERVLHELTRLLTGPWAGHGLEALRTTGLLRVALPELAPMAAEADQPRGPHREKDLWDHTRRVVDQAPPRPTVRWAALLHDAAKPATRRIDANGEIHFFGHEREGAQLARALLGRLNADRATTADVATLVEMHNRPETYDQTWTDSAVRRLLLEAGGIMPDLLDLAAADVTSAREWKQREAAARVAALRAHIERLEAERALAEYRSPLDGDDLMRLFERPPGRWIADVKDHLRELVLDGDLEPGDVVTAERIAREFLAGR